METRHVDNGRSRSSFHAVSIRTKAMCLLPVIGAVMLTILTLTGCNALPSDALVLGKAEAAAKRYWTGKYGESPTVSETYFPMRYVGEAATYQKGTVFVNMGEKGSRDALVMFDIDMQHVSDNRQSDDIQKALDGYVSDRLSDIGSTVEWAYPQSALANAPNEYEPITDEQWDMSQSGDGFPYQSWQGLTREQANEMERREWEQKQADRRAEVRPIAFNWESISIDYGQDEDIDAMDDEDAAKHMFFTTKYDAGTDIKDFAKTEQQQNKLTMDAKDTIFVAATKDSQIPWEYDEQRQPSWKPAVDSLYDWLSDTFTSHPGIRVMPEDYAEVGSDGNTLYRYAEYPERSQDASDMTKWDTAPVIDNWIPVGDDASAIIDMSSDQGGIMLTRSDLSASVSKVPADQVGERLRDAGYTSDDYEVLGNVYEVRLSERIRDAIRQRESDIKSEYESDNGMDLRLASYVEHRPDYSDPTDQGYAMNNPHLYAVAVGSVTDDGSIVASEDMDPRYPSYPERMEESDGSPHEWHLTDGSGTILLFVAKVRS